MCSFPNWALIYEAKAKRETGRKFKLKFAVVLFIVTKWKLVG